MLEMVEQAFFPTLQTVCDAPSTSPLQEINPVNLAELLLSLLPGKYIWRHNIHLLLTCTPTAVFFLINRIHNILIFCATHTAPFFIKT